jgi:hypothetical protein
MIRLLAGRRPFPVVEAVHEDETLAFAVDIGGTRFFGQRLRSDVDVSATELVGLVRDSPPRRKAHLLGRVVSDDQMFLAGCDVVSRSERSGGRGVESLREIGFEGEQREAATQGSIEDGSGQKADQERPLT